MTQPRLDIAPTAAGWTAAMNGGIVGVALQELASGAAPPLYGSGVRYDVRDADEQWRAPSRIQELGGGDCEDLSAQRAAELQLWGWRALLPGAPGRAEAQAADLRSIPARVRLDEVAPAFFHAVVEYTIGAQTYTEDPSLMLGMKGSVDPRVLALENTSRGDSMNSVPVMRVSGEPGANPALVVANLRLVPDEGYRVAVDRLEPGLYLVAVVPDEEEIAGSGAVIASSAVAAAALKALVARAAARATDGEPGILARLRERAAPKLAEVRDTVSARRDERGGLGERFARLREGDGQSLRDRLVAWRDERGQDDVFLLPRARVKGVGCECGR